ncbi:J domain-containing protein [Brachybacterium sacelli]|uniref:J domain-containing protein n=1 Tax=Brachybacterium sacelli TaxID=173364 RepID=A0ABS4X5Y5_9MICO|nr:J domain-containing protein [Brachybacterium sacelli]MBP2383793.1 hypothetical protein [Brachybacterium sacelli]
MAISHYETLGVDQDATRVEIAAAFRAQMRALHADAGGGDDELAKRVSSAYNVLSNASKRAAYDRTLAQSGAVRPDPSPASSTRPPKAKRSRVFSPSPDALGFSMMDVNPTAWDWHLAAESAEASTGTSASAGIGRKLLSILAFVAWAVAGAAAASTLGLPLARIEALSVPLALAAGAGAHLAWSALTVTRVITTRWGLFLSLVIALFAAGVIYLDAGTPLPTIGAGLCFGASVSTTYLSFGMALARSGRRRGAGIIDTSFITQVGATNLGDRHPDIDRLLGALKGAFGHRAGVRVILLPDRVTPRPGGSAVRSQVAVIVGRSIHLVAIPPLGGDGLEIAGPEIVSDRSVHRNVVRDEVKALAARLGRAGRAHGYIVPTKLSNEPPADTTAHGVTFGSLTQVIDAIGQDAGRDLDKENALFRQRALESMSLLV